MKEDTVERKGNPLWSAVFSYSIRKFAELLIEQKALRAGCEAAVA